MSQIGRPKNLDILLKQAQVNFTAYNMLVNGVGRNDPWQATPFHHYLCQKVQKFVERESSKPYDLMIINCPPQHGKSVTITETLPSWYLGHNPEHKVIEISYNSEFAQRFGKRNKEKVERFGGQIFGIGLSPNTKSSAEWELDNRIGGMVSVGFGGSITGRKGNLIIIDDPIKSAQESRSESFRNSRYEEWAQSIKTRTHPGSKIILIMTRWHEDDLAGRLLDEEECEYINLPCECEDEDDPLGRSIGDALCPEIGKDKTWLEDFKKSYIEGQGIGAWYAMYQGRPVTDGGNLFKKDWWQYYEVSPEVVGEMDELLMSVDAAFKDTSDPVCIQVWGRKKANLFLIDMINDRIDFPKTVSAIKGMKNTYPAIRQILIEDKANGSAIVATLRGEIQGIIPIEPLGGKVSRAQDVTFVVESKNVYLPSNRMFTREFVAQCLSFPNGKHDDMVDAMTQALTRMSKHKTHEKRPEQKSVMSFFGKSKAIERSKIGNGEKINVI